MALGTVGLNTHIWNNNIRSAMLLGLYPLLLAGILWAICFLIGTQTMPQPGLYVGAGATFDIARPAAFATRLTIEYAPLVVAAVAIWFLIAWFFNTRMVRALSHSHPVTRQQEPALYNLLENLCISAGMTMPKLEIIETHARNAFASGIDQKSFTITVTRGLLNALTPDEVEAVLGHELSHIRNRDVRLLIISVIFTGMLGFAAQMAWSSFRYNLWSGSARSYARSRRQNNNLPIMLFILGVMAVLWVGYGATLLTRFAISRRREFMADAGAIQLTKNPEAMMRALMRIAQRDRIPDLTGDIAMMCIENSHAFLGVFATHPPIEARIRAISATTGTPVPALQSHRAPDPERFGIAQPGNPWITRQRNLGQGHDPQQRRGKPWG
ncbi:MAG TPA: M48 family metallopeptidase [Micavibrio sp.]